MVTLRYTAEGNYSNVDSRSLDASFFADLSHDYTVSFGISGTRGGVVVDNTDGTRTAFHDEVTGSTDFRGGLYLDLSNVTGRLYLGGGDFGDIMIGGSNDDQLYGNDGNDVLEGGAGADTYDGGTGFNTVSYEHAGAAVTYSEFLPASQGDAVGDSFTNIQAIVGSAFDDTFYVTKSYTIEGGAGADMIFDVFNAGVVTASYVHSASSVNVDLAAGTGSGGDAEGDALVGVTGLLGSRHADTLVGAADASVLKGYGGLDTITGGAGDDTIAVTGKWAMIDGGDGVDRLLVRSAGTSAPISIDAGTLVNVERVIVANGTFVDLSLQSAIDGAIKLNSRSDGFAGVIGTGFNDRITGGLGIDIIIGGGGHDRLTGGEGSDIFAVASSGRSGVITDFSGHNGDGDLIIFGTETVSAPTFVEAFSASGFAEVRTEMRAPDVQLVFLDSDGDGRADASIRVNSADAITADDFFQPSSSSALQANALASHSTFAEMLMPHDIAGLI